MCNYGNHDYSRLSADLTDFIETEDLDTFTLQDLEEYNVSHPVQI